MTERQDPLDHVLDEALASYSQAPEIEGIERRILARVAQRPRSMRLMQPLMVAMGAALIAVTAGLFWWLKTNVQTNPASTILVASKMMETPSLRAIPLPAPRVALLVPAKTRQVHKPPAAPKLSRFPAPSPLSSEERALVQLVASAGSIPKQLSDFGGPVKPIQVTAIEVKPLRMEWNTEEKHAAIIDSARSGRTAESALPVAK